MKQDIKLWTQTCIQCQKSKVHGHNFSPHGHFKEPDARFKEIHVDVVGPFPHSCGYKYLLTCIDRFTRWVEAIPIADITTSIIASAFVRGWISRFGVPETVTSDRGSQFESKLNKELMIILGAHRIRTTSYHPQANGMVERFHRQLKSSLRAQEDQNLWYENLSLVLLGIRASLKEDIGCSSAELVYGTTLTLPGEFFSDSKQNFVSDPTNFVSRLRSRMRHLRPAPTRNNFSNKIFIHKDLESSSHVFIRKDTLKKPLEQPYSGPYRIIERFNKFFKIEKEGKHDNISIDRLKPAYFQHVLMVLVQHFKRNQNQPNLKNMFILHDFNFVRLLALWRGSCVPFGTPSNMYEIYNSLVGFTFEVSRGHCYSLF